MIDILKAHILNKLGSDNDRSKGIDLVLNSFKPFKINRNQFLLREGEVCKYVYFLAKGCLQVFVYDNDMNETTRDIVVAENWCSELISFGSGNPSSENIRTIEPCELLAIDRQSFHQLQQSVPAFDYFYKQLLELSYYNSVYRINTFVALSALDRIKWLMEKRPDLMTRVSSKLIASYLGINKDVYSRLKAKL